MEFVGVQPWPRNQSIIECEIDARTYDLHNYADFHALVFAAPGTLTLTFRILPGDERSVVGLGESERRELARGARGVALRFDAVRDLRLEQAEDFEPRASDVIHGWSWNEEPDGRGWFDFQVADSTLEFTAGSVSARECTLPPDASTRDLLSGATEYTPPIVVIDRAGEVAFYSSAEGTGIDLESPDVEAGEYRAFDAVGRPLALVPERPATPPRRFGPFEIVSSRPVRVRTTDAAPRPDELREALLGALRRYGGVPAGLSDAPLSEVVEAARQQLA